MARRQSILAYMTRSKPVTLPPRLGAGARVALVAPSGPCLEQDDFTRAVELCRALGLDAVLGPHVRDRLGYLAGSDADRLADLNAALRNPAIDAVWCIRGGYGMTRILEGVDFAALRQRPKAIIGYSDITALLNGGLQEAGVVTFHGPTARNLARDPRVVVSVEEFPAYARIKGVAVHGRAASINTSPRTRSGCVSATSAAIVPPIE